MAVVFHCSSLQLTHYLFLPFFLCVTSSSDLPVSSFPLPDWHSAHFQYLTKREVDYFPRAQANLTVLDPRLYSERLDIVLVQSATSWLEIRWRLENKTGAIVAVPRFSRVRCHFGNTTTVVHDITGSSTQFRIPNLSSNTRYVICVETIDSEENYLHYRCVPFRTIPLVRPDSVLGLLLSIGYIFVMGMIGYVTWCMRMRKYTSSHKRNNEMELSCRTSTVRVSEIEERVQLNSHSAPSNNKASQLNSGPL